MVIILGQGSVLLGEYFVKASSEGLDDNAFTFSDINSRAVQLGAITLNSLARFDVSDAGSRIAFRCLAVDDRSR
jgi:hypothetical protein